MAAKFQEYKTSFKGVNSTEFYINKLRTYSGFKIIIEKNEESFRVQVIESLNTIPDLSEIESNITERERKLKLNVPDLVKKTAEDIDRAYKAEQIVKEGILSVWLPNREENATAEVILAIRTDGDPVIMETCDHYAYIRIMELTNALDMTLDGNIEKL